MMRATTTFALAALLLLAAQAAGRAQPAAPRGVPQALHGAWYAGGDCAAPQAVLLVTARAVARLPEAGPMRLVRFTAIAPLGDWTMGTGRGAEAPRVLLRAPATDALETLEPEAKTRDDQLPGSLPVARWSRCPAPPPALAALHGEGAAFLASLERIEAGCGAGATIPSCLGAVMAEADVSGDGGLAPAELARMVRGAAWLSAAAEGAEAETLGAALGAGAVGGILSARMLVESLDYDGDGRLSAAELAQDRTAFATRPGTAAGRPLRMEGLAEGAEMLRSLLGVLLGENR